MTPDATWLWVLAVAVVCIVAALAIWRGAGTKFGLGPKGLTIDTAARPVPNNVAVANDAHIGGEAGNITGVSGPASGSGSIEVASRLHVGKGGKVGDITGNLVQGLPAAPRDKPPG